MVKIQIDSNIDVEVINRLTALKPNITDTTEFLISNHFFASEESLHHLIGLFLRASMLWPVKSQRLTDFLLASLARLPDEARILTSSVIKSIIIEDLELNVDQSAFHAPFFAVTVREGILKPKDCLEAVLPSFSNTTQRKSHNLGPFSTYLFVWCGDLLYEADANSMDLIKSSCERRSYGINQVFENHCEIARQLADPNSDIQNEYHILKYDNVKKLQIMAKDPSFSNSTPYSQSVWELDMILDYGATFMQAAAFYGAEKCYQFLTMQSSSDPTKTNPSNMPQIFFNRQNFDQPSSKDKWVKNGKHFLPSLSPMPSFVIPIQMQNTHSFALAGGSISLLNQIPPKEDEEQTDFAIAAMTNNVEYFKYLLKNVQLKQTTISLIMNSIVASDNSTFLRYICEEKVLNIINVMTTQLVYTDAKEHFLIEFHRLFKDHEVFDIVMNILDDQIIKNRPKSSHFLEIMATVCHNGLMTIQIGAILKRPDIVKVGIEKGCFSSSVVYNVTNYSLICDIVGRSTAEIIELVARAKIPNCGIDGQSLLFYCVEFDRIEAVNRLLNFEELRKSVKIEDLLTAAGSIEMRRSIESTFSED